MSSSAYNTTDKIISLDWNGQYFVLTARNEITDASFIYAYSSDGRSWSKNSFPANISSQNPYMVKWLGDKYIVTGNLTSTYTTGTGSSSTQSCIVNIVDGAYPVTSNTNLSSTTIIHDVEKNIEQSHRIVFPRTTALALGSTIAFSYDQGNSWTTSSTASSLFSGGAKDSVWNGSIWVAGGTGPNHTIATSLDGNNWAGRGNYAFSSSCNGVDWSQQQNKFVAVGSGTNIVATSSDGVYWKGANTTLFSTGNDIKWNGSVWVAVGSPSSGGKSIAYSSDGVTWNYPAQSDLFSVAGIRVFWDGTLWTVFGSDSSSNNIATSSDGMTWTMSYSASANAVMLNLPTGLFPDPSLNIYPGVPYPLRSADAISATKYVHNHSDMGAVFIQPISIACGEGSTSMAYSPDGIQWTAINTDIFTRCNRAIWNGTVWVAVGTGNYWAAISYDGISWQGSNSVLMTESFDVTWNGQYFVAVGQGSSKIARSTDGITWTAVSESIFSTNITSIDWTGNVWLAYGSGGNTTAISSSVDASSWTAQNLCDISCTNLLLANSPTATASSYQSSNVAGNSIDGSFNATMTQWISAGSNYDASGSYIGSTSTTYNTSSTASGEWLQIALSSSVLCKNYYIIFSIASATAIPKSWVLLGSNDGSAWNLLDTFTFSILPNYTSGYPFACLPLDVSSNTTSYSYYRVVFTSNFGADSVSVAELVLFNGGTRVLNRYIRPVILKDCVLHPTRILSVNGSTPNIYRITDLSCNLIRDNALHNQYANNIMYGLSGEISSCAFNGEIHVVGSRTGEVAYISNNASVGNLAFDTSINGVAIQSGIGAINVACYNRKYILLGGASGSVTYCTLNSAGTPTFYNTNASSLFSTIYSLASNPGYGAIVCPNRIYMQEDDRLSVVTPKYYDAALSSDTSISFNVYRMPA